MTPPNGDDEIDVTPSSIRRRRHPMLWPAQFVPRRVIRDPRSAVRAMLEVADVLRRTGYGLLVVTVVNVLSVFFSVSIPGYSGLLSLQTWPIISAFVTGMSMLLAARFDIERRGGSAVYDEFVQELQSRYRDDEKGLPRLEERIALKEFTLASTPPLIPSAWGPAIYVAVNVCSFLFIGIYRSL